MIVTCESCQTKFRLDPSRLRGPESKVRCSRCGNVFNISPPEEEDGFLDFDLPESTPELASEIPVHPPIPGPVTASSAKKSSSSKTLLIWIIPLLLLGAASLWVIGQKVASTSSNRASQPPIVESGVTPDKPSVNIMDTTQAYFLENAYAGQIFVVEGEVKNESATPVSFILLEGKLYSTDNKVAQSQRCFCGNVMSREELVQLNVTEIQDRMMNREGKDLENVHLAQGQSVPFMLVFHNLPELNTLTDYSVEVVSSEFD